MLRETLDHINRVLEICAHQNDAVSGHLRQSVIRGIELPEILDVKDCLDVAVSFAKLADIHTCEIFGVIVDKTNLIIVLRQCVHLSGNGLAQRDDVVFFIVTWYQNRYFLFLRHYFSLSEIIS